MSATLPRPELIRNAAIAVLKAGLSAIPTDPKTKQPVQSWKAYQSQRMNPRHAMQQGHNWRAIGIVTGAVSGNLECIDFDHKARLYPQWKALVDAECPGLVDRLTKQRTQSGGLHVVYRCPGATIPGNTKLARDKIEVPGPGEHDHEGKPYKAEEDGGKWFIHPCLVETRGTGGQFLADPSPGYELTNGSWEEIAVVTPEQREIMIRAARALDMDVTAQADEPKPSPGKVEFEYIAGDRPGDWYNEHGPSFLSILEPHGWTDTGISKDEFQHVRRPGKTRGWSASVVGGNVLKVFSTNAAPFEEGRAYSRFQVYALLEHGGDFSAAARAVRKMMPEGNDTNDTSKKRCHAQGSSNHAAPDSYDTNDAPQECISEKCDALPPPPLHVFHPEVAHLIKEVAQAKSAPVEAAIAPLLSVIAAMIGRRLGLRVKIGWIEFANLYIALIALSGSGKSPVTSFFFRIIRKLEKQFQKEFEAAIQQYELDLLQWQKDSKRKDVTPCPKPVRPKREDILVDDWTVESLTDTLSGNPWGILAYRDELAGLLLELDKYSNGSGGGTKNRLMSAYDCGPWKTSRINQSRVSYVPAACISLYGTIQPVQAKEIFTGLDEATGFLSRFLMINAAIKSPAYFSEKSESLEAIHTIERLIGGLYKIRKRKEQ